MLSSKWLMSSRVAGREDNELNEIIEGKVDSNFSAVPSLLLPECVAFIKEDLLRD